jgi:hypothetical protein
MATTSTKASATTTRGTSRDDERYANGKGLDDCRPVRRPMRKGDLWGAPLNCRQFSERRKSQQSHYFQRVSSAGRAGLEPATTR